MLLLDLLLLLTLANGAPILARRVLGARGAWPLDGGRRLPDGQPLFGPSKTWRGLLAAAGLTEATALLLGFPPGFGLRFALLVMLADLLTSFLKRRLRIAASGRAPLLDQVPESLLPLLAVRAGLDLQWVEILGVVVAFLLLDLLLSRLLYRLHIRRHPY